MRTASAGVPSRGPDSHSKIGVHGEPRRQLRALSIDRDAPHDRGIAVAQRRIFFDVKKYFKRVSGSHYNSLLIVTATALKVMIKLRPNGVLYEPNIL